VTLGELKEALDGYDDTLEVQVRVSISDDADAADEASRTSLDEWSGEYCDVTDERSVLIEYAKLTIVADWQPPEE
jgi:hypothetical protein